MKNITAITEKRIKQMKKDNHKFAYVLEYILREIKCVNGCDGATIAQLKKLGLELPNETQINTYEIPEMNGLSIIYPEYIHAVFCADLHYLNIYDFNNLVKTLYLIMVIYIYKIITTTLQACRYSRNLNLNKPLVPNKSTLIIE